MQFPSGMSDFGALIQGGYWYQDRTDRLALLEAAGRQVVFLRSRRFGKSLLLSLLEHDYDCNRAGQFADLFGGLAVGRSPTPLANAYYTAKLSVFSFEFFVRRGKNERNWKLRNEHLKLFRRHDAVGLLAGAGPGRGGRHRGGAAPADQRAIFACASAYGWRDQVAIVADDAIASFMALLTGIREPPAGSAC